VTAAGVQRRRSQSRPMARRRAGPPERLATDPMPRLFPDGGEGAAAAADRPGFPERRTEGPEEAAPRAGRSGSAGGRGDGMTLEQLISGVWDEVLATGRAACPLCGGELLGRASAHARATEGRCRDCGTTIG